MKKIHAFGCSLTAQHNWKYMNDCEDGPLKEKTPQCYKNVKETRFLS